MSRSLQLCALAAVGLLVAVPCYSQSILGSITGVVTDPNGATVPGAKVKAVQQETNYTYEAETNASGVYTVPNLREGTYRVTFTAAGFQEFVADNLRMFGRDTRRLDAALQLGQVQTAIQVDAGVTLIETESARISDVKTQEVLRGLPLSLRRTADFYQLTPNVNRGTQVARTRFSGSRSRQSEIVVDGVSNSSAFGGTNTGVSLDRTEGFQEFRVDAAGNSAEFAAIGQVTIVTRSGSNQFHGIGFTYYQTPGLIARNPFSTAATGSVEHIPGVSASGPVYIPKIYDGRDRTFVFGSIEFERLGGPNRTLFNPSVALPAWRQGNFSALAPQTVVRDPATAARTPFPNNTIPASRINPVSAKIQDRFFPLPNVGDGSTFFAQNFNLVEYVNKNPNPTMVFKVDHRFGDRTFAYWRATTTRWIQNQFEGALPTIGQRDGNRYSNSMAASFTHSIRPTLISETTWGFASDNIPAEMPINGPELVRELGLTNLAPNLPNVGGVFTVGFTNLGLTGISSSTSCNPCGFNKKTHFQQNFSSFRGLHTLKGGFYMGYGKYQDLRQGAALFGSHTYSNRFTGFTYADFLLGIPTTASRNFPAIFQDVSNFNYSGFFQDDWKIHPKLTLNLGVRYEVKPGFTAAGGQQAVFDIGSGKIVVPDGGLSLVSPLMPRGYVDVVEASAVGFPSSTLIRTDRNNFAPRVGFAWRPLDNKTVFRGGFGIFYDLVARNASAAGVPFNLNEPNFTNPATNPTLVLPTVFPATSAGPTSVTIPGAINPDIRIPYSMQYSATIEHERGDVGFRLSYVGTNTRQGVYGYNYNQPVADNRPFVDKPRPFPLYPGVNYTTNGAGHQYHAMTLEVERSMKNGLFFQSYYTWARDIGDLDDAESPEDSFNRRRERAVSGDIPTHRWVSSILYDLPVGKGRTFLANTGRFADAVIGGWRLGTVYSVESGLWMSPAWTGPDPTGTRFTPNRTPANVTIRPDHIANPKLDDPTVQRWFNPAAFAAPQAGSFGTSAKNVILGQGINVMQASLAKYFSIKERARLRLELIATNALNRPHYTPPNTNISQTGAVGTINNVVNRNNRFDTAIPRLLQLHLRLDW